MEVVKIAEKGRGLVATTDHKEGATLLEEEPICSAQFSWGRKLDYRACFHCLRPLELPNDCITRLTKGKITNLPENEWSVRYSPPEAIKCHKSEVEYCSQECIRNADHEYMRLLVPNWNAVEELEDLWRDIHFPPEEASIMLMVKLLAMKQLDPSLADKLSKFESSAVEGGYVHQLLGDKFDSCLKLISEAMRRIFDDVTLDDVLWAFSLCGRNQQGLGTSAIIGWIKAHDDEEFVDALYDTCEETCGIQFMDNEGCALFSTQAMLNHDCDPNAEIKYLNDTHRLTLLATRDVAVGEEVCISYLDDCMLSNSKRRRREYLESNYLFYCNCKRCNSEDTDNESSCEETDDEEGNEESFS